MLRRTAEGCSGSHRLRNRSRVYRRGAPTARHAGHGSSLTPPQPRSISAAAFRSSTCSAIVIARRARTIELGRAYAIEPARSRRRTSFRAINTFRELGARLDLVARRRRARQISIASTPEPSLGTSALTQLLTLRLAEAVASRELLLRELAAVMRQETTAQRVMITEQGEHHRAASGHCPWAARRPKAQKIAEET